MFALPSKSIPRRGISEGFLVDVLYLYEPGGKRKTADNFAKLEALVVK